MMNFVSPGMEELVAPRLFLTKNVSCRDVTPFRTARVCSRGASGCKCSFQTPPFHSTKSLSFVSLLAEKSMWSTHCPWPRREGLWLVLTEWEELPVACSRHGGVSSACRKTTLCCNTSLARRFPVMVCWLTEIVKIIMTINAVSDHNYIWLVAFFSASLRRCCVVLSLSAMIQQEIMTKKKRRKKGELE